MLITGIIVTVIALFLIIIYYVEEDKGSVLEGVFYGILLIIGVLLIWAGLIGKIKKSTKDFHVTTEINITYKNGVEIDRDTTYIFIDKK